MTARDWRAGELHFLLLALVVAIAALCAVAFFVDRLHAGFERDAHQLLGADLVVSADQPISTAWEEQARRRGLRVAQTLAFPSMALGGSGDDAPARLAAVKAVSPGYPLRGRLKLAMQPDGPAMTADGIPQTGTVWVDPDLLLALKVRVGGRIKLGDALFTVSRVIVSEPDRGSGFMNFAPRVMLPLADLPATHLVQPGSRVTYRLLIAGDERQVQAMQQWVNQQIDHGRLRGIHVDSLENGQPEMRATLDRAQRFLALVSLLATMLSAIATAMAARRFMLRHIDACALLRCLGLRQRDVSLLFLIEFMLIGIAASALGVATGFVAHYGLLTWLGSLVPADLPAPGMMPALQGFAAGMLLLLGFALLPVLQLGGITPGRILRRERHVARPLALATYGGGLLAFFALLLWQAGDLKLGLLVAGGFAGSVLLFAALAFACVRLLQLAKGIGRNAIGWRFALQGLRRRPVATVVQTVALALGLMALLLLTMVRGELVSAWRRSVPPDAPNRFAINIQPDQREPIARQLRQAGVPSPRLYPMIRGRLVQINDAPVTRQTYTDDRAQHLVDREFNLSAMPDLPPDNRIVAGHWLDDRQAQASVEEGLAKTLRLHLGDRLRFDVAGQPIDVTITSLRKLDWGSMRVNFFVIVNPSSVADLPQTWITAFYLPDAKRAFADALVREFPNLTIVDVDQIIKQIQAVIEQVVSAVEFLFLFALLAGVLVLYAALASSQDERKREAALLRALGATSRQLAVAQWIEFSLSGALAGFLAAAGASALGWALARYVFNFEWAFGPAIWIAGMAAGAFCALAGSHTALRNVVRQPPLQTLREAAV